MKDYIKVVFTHDSFEEESTESAWCKILDNEIYELDNILFYAKEYSYKDRFTVEKINGEFIPNELIEESGHTTVRVLFSDKELVTDTREELKKMGCDSELSNLDNLIAVDIPKKESYALVRNFLDEGEDKELWEYEEACISQHHQKDLE